MTETTSSAARPRRKRRNQYHHGDLRRALLDQALRTIQRSGVEALTLRAIAESLGVSRTALYRHFTDKTALLAVVATEGFRMLRERLLTAWDSGGHGVPGFNEMGAAYVRFAIENPSHYRVMFGSFGNLEDAALATEGAGAFQALVDALISLQGTGAARADDPVTQAHFIWAAVHGVSMLIIDGRFGPDQDRTAAIMRFTIERLMTGIEA